MSWQLKFLLVFAAIVLGTVLYIRLPPYIEAARSEDASSSGATTATTSASDDNIQIEQSLKRAIAPCWNRQADHSTPPVRLKLSFDETGQLSAPPEIERAPGAEITDHSLKSETMALQALQACAPYSIARNSTDLMIEFPTPPARTAKN